MVLSDLTRDEGVYVVKNSHKTPPESFLRKVYEHNTGEKQELNTPQKCVMIPKPKEEPCSGERLGLARGDILAYHGNLSYCVYAIQV